MTAADARTVVGHGECRRARCGTNQGETIRIDWRPPPWRPNPAPVEKGGAKELPGLRAQGPRPAMPTASDSAPSLVNARHGRSGGRGLGRLAVTMAPTRKWVGDGRSRPATAAIPVPHALPAERPAGRKIRPPNQRTARTKAGADHAPPIERGPVSPSGLVGSASGARCPGRARGMLRGAAEASGCRVR